VPISESTHLVGIHLAAHRPRLRGWEAAFVRAREQLSPQLFAAVLAHREGELIRAACGPRYRPEASAASFQSSRCGARSGFRRRGRRRRWLLTRVGRLDLTLAMVGCRCGHRFAPLLAVLGISTARRIAPGLERRILELCTELPYRRAEAALRREAGVAPSERTLRRIVRRAAARCDLRAPRGDVDQIEAVLVDGTRIRAGAKKRPRDDRGIELDSALALCGRDRATCCSPDASPTPTGADSAMMPAQFRFGPSSNESTNCRAISALRRLRSAGSTRYPHSTSSFDSPGDYLLRIGQQTQEICSATTSPRVDSAVTCATGDRPLPHPSGQGAAAVHHCR
jgi:hypothetical protein